MLLHIYIYETINTIFLFLFFVYYCVHIMIAYYYNDPLSYDDRCSCWPLPWKRGNSYIRTHPVFVPMLLLRESLVVLERFPLVMMRWGHSLMMFCLFPSVSSFRLGMTNPPYMLAHLEAVAKVGSLNSLKYNCFDSSIWYVLYYL